MFRNLTAIIVTLLLSVHGLKAEIIESKDISILLELTDDQTLFVSDLNNVLMETAQDLGSDAWAGYEVKRQMKETGLSKMEVLHTFVPFWHRILLVAPVKAVEGRAPEVIRQMQNRGTKVMGLTARYTEMAYPTHSQLRSIGIHMEKNTVYAYDWEIEGGYASKFVEGIVFVGLRNDKGETLMRCLDQLGFKPKKIVFIDDKLKNVLSVQKAVEARGIPFTGVRYGYLDESVQDFDPAQAQAELEAFLRAAEA